MKTIQRAFLAALFLAAPAFAADGIAFITNLKGDVAVDGNPRPRSSPSSPRGRRSPSARTRRPR